MPRPPVPIDQVEILQAILLEIQKLRLIGKDEDF